MQDEAAGDQYAGRVVAGLSVMTSEFANLPPHLPPNSIISDDLNTLFPAFSDIEAFSGVLTLGLASLLHHRQFLLGCLPKKHRLFSSPLYSNWKSYQHLSSEVITGITSPYMSPTGIPPHVAILLHLKGVEMNLSALPPALVEQLEEMLQRNGAAAANVTPDGINRIVSNAIESALSKHLGTQGQFGQPALTAQIEDTPTYQLYSWGGSFHKLPLDYTFPDVTVAAAYRYWHIGSEEENLPPFKSLEPTDFSKSNERKRLSDWKYIMKEIIGVLADDYEDESSNINVINSQFKLAMERIPRVDKKKRTRPEEWALVTAVRELRAAKKARIASEAEEASS